MHLSKSLCFAANTARGNVVGKAIALVLMVLLAVASAAGYWFLTEAIAAGEGQVAEARQRLEQGRVVLEQGKEKLAAGKRESSAGKEEYERAKDNVFLVLMDKLLKGGRGFKGARERIAEGDTQIARGEEKVTAGEQRLDAGEENLRRGLEELELARRLRVACAVGALLFGLVSAVLGFRWRRSLLGARR